MKHLRAHASRSDIVLVIGLAILAALFVAYLGPNIVGDTPSYIQAMNVMGGAHPAPGFMPNRLLTTAGALALVRALGWMFGNVYAGWFFLNVALFFASGMVFYRLLARFTKSEPAACLSALFLAANYGYLLFGLNYLMDIGGWSFYIFSLYLIWRYAESKQARYIGWAALAVGLGGLFKEYAFLGGVAIAAYLIIECVRNARARTNWKKPLGLLIMCGAIAALPTAIVYAHVFWQYGYTYLDWFGANAVHYVYHSRIVEYIKALGSLYNLFAFLVIGGLITLWKERRALSAEAKAFLAAMLVSFLPIFCWPAITQRILTITVPFAALIAASLFKRYERCWYVFAAILIVYAVATFFMDSVILKAVNLPF